MVTNNRQLYDLILTGKITGDHPLPVVKQLLSKALHIDIDQLDAAFQKKNVCIKPGLSKQAAKKYQRIFLASGAYCSLQKQPTLANSPDPGTSASEAAIQSLIDSYHVPVVTSLNGEIGPVISCPYCDSGLIRRIRRGFVRKSILKSPPLFRCGECKKSFYREKNDSN